MLAAALVGLAAACVEGEPAPPAPSLGDPVQGLSDAGRGRFLLGRALFDRIAIPEEGLGPLFNADRCSSCHDGPVSGGDGVAIPVLKASRFVDGSCSTLREEGGDNLQQRATPAALRLGMGPEPVPGQATATVYVVAPQLFGLGLLEAVPEAEILSRADPDDANGDGISGRPALVPDGRLARFGRKGDAVSVQDFVEQALLFELGLTTPRFPLEEGHVGAAMPTGADPSPEPELTSDAVALLTDFVRYLAPPAPSGSADTDVEAGAALFQTIGCAACHTPSLGTGAAPEAALSHVAIEPYSDLLLHDLGFGPGDVCTPAAAPGEYRTAPLWGLAHRRAFLHDGRAATVHDAVAAHAGEAQGARDAYLALQLPDRQRILAFLSGL